MNEKKNQPLNELVDLHELQLIQDSFAETVGTSSVIFSSGCEPLTEFSNPTGFCSLIQSTDAGKQRCFQSFQEMTAAALESGKPKIMYCFAHGGHFVAPIIIDGKHKGTMFAGQFIPSEFSEGQLDDLRQIAGDIGLDPETLLAKAEQMRVVREDVVWNYSSLLFQIVRVIAKLGSQAGELRQAGDALQKAHNGLEKRVQERTSELAEANAGLHHEIAERKSAEDSLRDSETRFRSLAESMSDWIWEVDSDAVYTYCSGNVKDVLGYSAEEMIGKTPFDLMAPDMNTEVSATFNEVVREKRPFKDLENWLMTRDGRLVCMLSSGVPIPDATGELLGYRGVDSDITRRKATEKALVKSEEKHRTLVETLTDLVFMIDMEGRFTYLSPIFEDITGYPVRDFIGHSFTEVIVPEYIESTVNRFKQGVSGEEIPLYEIELIHKDKKSVPIELNVTSLLDADGAVIGRTGTARDITKRKELEQQLQQTFDKLKSSYEELSIPVIQVWAGVLVLPIIGVLDSERINRLMEMMLAKIVETQSGVVIIDVTGVHSVDTNVANHLINVTTAAKLLGTKCVVTGIKPDVAHTLIGLGVDMSEITTMRSMQEGLKYAMQIAGAGG